MSNSSSSSTSGNSPPSSSSDDSNDSPSSGSSPPSPSSNSSPPSPSSSSSSSSSSSPLSPKASPPPPNSSPPPPSDDDDSPSPPPPSSSSSSSSPSNSKSPPPPQNSSPPPSPPKNSPSPPSGSSPSDDDNSPSTPSDNDNSPSTPSDDDNSPSTPSLVTPPSSRGGNSPSDSDPSSTPAISDSPPIPRGSQPNGIGSTSPSRPSNNTPSSNNSQGGGALVGVVVVGVVVVLFAMCCIVMMRKRRRGRMDALDYRPPTSISIRSDGGYYKQTNTLGGSARSDSYHVSQQHHGASGMMGGGSNRYGYHSGPMDMAHTGSTSFFSYEELVDATGGFSQENMIGEGGFGCVYKGTLSDGRKIAVKQLKAGSGQGEREFQAEVETISRVHHRHLVTLVGYCISEYHRLLVYEFLPNNTLEHHLHAKGLPAMEWDKRMKIAIGSAKGFAYLHEDCHPKIIHRDIKSANILLEDSFEPQVADFGLAKLSNDTHTHVSTRVMGTFGYLAPEYASSGKLTDRSDVFSFGVVLLEIITGRKPVDSTRPYGDESLVEWARPLLVRALETGNCDELVDPRLEGNYNKAEMFNMIEAAAACVRHSAPKRPRMVQVVRALDRQDDMPDLTNGVKYGQSQGFTPAQQSADMQRFRRMAFGNDTDNYEYESGEYDRRSAGGYSGEYRSREHRPPPPPQPNSWCSPPDPNTYDSDTKAMFRSERSTGGGGVQNYRNF